MTSMLLQPDLPALSRAGANAEQLRDLWKLFTKVKDNVENGRRLENLSWRLWYRSTSVHTGSLPRSDTSLSVFVSEIFDKRPVGPRLPSSPESSDSSDSETSSPTRPASTAVCAPAPAKRPQVHAPAPRKPAASTAAAHACGRRPTFFITDPSSTDSDDDDAAFGSDSDRVAARAAAAAPPPAPAPALAPAPAPAATAAARPQPPPYRAAEQLPPAPTSVRTMRRDPAAAAPTAGPALFKRTEPAAPQPRPSALSALLKSHSAPLAAPGGGAPGFGYFGGGPSKPMECRPGRERGARETARVLEVSESVRQGLLIDRQTMFNLQLFDAGRAAGPPPASSSSSRHAVADPETPLW